MTTPDWRPAAALEQLRARAAMLASIRQFFSERNVLEVEVPVLDDYASADLHIDSIAVPASQSWPRDRYLQTSPEFAMKRLLAAGSGDIYCLGKAFRQGERGRRHNPEFTMLEWYRPGWTLEQLAGEVGELLCLLLDHADIKVDSYRDLFIAALDLDPHRADIDSLQRLVHTRIEIDTDGLDHNDLLDLLFSHCVEPDLGHGGPQAVLDFPASQCALARVGQDIHGNTVARRFEFYVAGIELANGYDELTDAQEQASRFANDAAMRRRRGLPPHEGDPRLVAALEAGMPDCAGVALGVDRLLMLVCGVDNIDAVLAFPAVSG